MTVEHTALPAHYRRTLFALLRYAIAMAFFGLLVGIAFQESATKLPFAKAGAGLHIESIFSLSLVHGHVFMMGVVMPLVLGGALLMAHKAGGREVGPVGLAWLVRGYLPFATLSVLLQLVKGYHVLLAVRGGQTDLAVVDAAFLGGSHALRAAVYGIAHTGMAVALGVFLVALWKSLRPRGAA
ncbi:MAG TPA: hypothetical protein PLQ13_05640 [Candidatus Krumholzibacteria bacterium]|nr:hypothetical protein [Candidatus Krumholzibacteria bacterium]